VGDRSGVGAAVIRGLVEKTPRVLPPLPAGENQTWQVHYVFFARAGFTEAAQAEAATVKARLVDLLELEAAW